MAGLGRKVFAAGDVLAAADVDSYLMDQAVQTFATSAARSSAVGTAVSEGMVSFLKATDANDVANQLDFYNGSAWESVRGYDVAGKNKIINGGFDIWQRGTSFTAPTTAYTSDRWQNPRAGFASGATITQQSPGSTLPQFKNCIRVARDSGNTSTAAIYLGTNLDSLSSIPLAGQTVTMSFYARAGANYSPTSGSIGAYVISGTGTDQNAVTGSFTGSSLILADTSKVLTTSWQRFSYNAIVPATSTQLSVQLIATPTGTAGAADYFEVTGVQLEAGSIATPFSRAGGTLQGELAACQRYYWRSASGSDGVTLGATGAASSVTNVVMNFLPPVNMRTVNGIDYSLVGWTDYVTSGLATVLTIVSSQPNAIKVNFTTTGVTQYRPYLAQQYGAGSGYVGFTAEL